MSDFNVVIDGVSITRVNGVINIQTINKASGEFPQYESDTVDDLKYGGVAEQVVNKLTRLGDIAVIQSHSIDTIRNAAYYHGFSVTTRGTKKESLGLVGKQTWRVKRVLRNTRKESKHERAMERLVA